MSTKQAVIYIRLSRYNGSEDPTTSLERQEQACRDYLKAQGWELIEIVKDLDMSGSDKGLRLDRPGLKRIRELFAVVDAVVFLKVDRLARNVVDFDTFVKEAKEHCVDMVSVRDGLDLTTPGGRFTAQILAAFAEMESATTAERIRDGVKAARSAGRWRGGIIPFGYSVIPNPQGAGKVLEINPEEAAFAHSLLGQVKAGVNGRNLIRWANSPNSVKPRKAEAWSMQTLRSVFCGPALEGRQVVQRRDPANPKRVLRDEYGIPLFDPLLDLDGNEVRFPAIITHEEAKVLRSTLASKLTGKARNPGFKRLLSGLMSCGTCGSRLIHVSRENGKYAYRCCENGKQGTCSLRIKIGADSVEAYISAEFLRIYKDAFEYVSKLEISGAEALKLAEEKHDEALVVLRASATPENFFNLQEAEKLKNAALLQPRELITQFIPTGKSLNDVWDGADAHERRKLLASHLISAVVSAADKKGPGFDPSRLSLVWRPVVPPSDRV